MGKEGVKRKEEAKEEGKQQDEEDEEEEKEGRSWRAIGNAIVAGSAQTLRFGPIAGVAGTHVAHHSRVHRARLERAGANPFWGGKNKASIAAQLTTRHGGGIAAADNAYTRARPGGEAQGGGNRSNENFSRGSKGGVAEGGKKTVADKEGFAIVGSHRWDSSKRANAAVERSRGAGGGGRSTYFPISFGQDHGGEDGGDAASVDDLSVAGDGVDVEGQDWKGDEVEAEAEAEGEEESQSEQADRLRAVWEEKRNQLAPLRRQGLRKGDEIYDFALGKAEEAESAWRAIRGPMPRETRRRKALEAIQRWEARCLKLQGEVDSAEAQL